MVKLMLDHFTHFLLILIPKLYYLSCFTYSSNKYSYLPVLMEPSSVLKSIYYMHIQDTVPLCFQH